MSIECKWFYNFAHSTISPPLPNVRARWKPSSASKLNFDERFHLWGADNQLFHVLLTKGSGDADLFSIHCSSILILTKCYFPPTQFDKKKNRDWGNKWKMWTALDFQSPQPTNYPPLPASTQQLVSLKIMEFRKSLCIQYLEDIDQLCARVRREDH